MQEESLIREFPKGLIQWYQFYHGAKALFVSGGEESCEVFTEVMEERGVRVTCVLLSQLDEADTRTEKVEDLNESYDYIIMAGVLERSKDPASLLQFLYGLLDPEGRLLIGADNRLGIRYFCGDRDPYSGRNFDGIENYVRLSELDWKRVKGHAYSKAEVIQILEKSGFCNYRFYSVFPEWTRPQALYAEDYAPKKVPEEKVVPQYHSPDTIFLEEERLYSTLIENGIFHTMANGFLIECSLDGTFSEIRQVTFSMEDGREESLATIIRRDGKVEKRALYKEGQDKLKRLMENTMALKGRGIHVVEGCLEKENGNEPVFIMPYVAGETAVEYFRRLVGEDEKLFLQKIDRFWEEIKRSSDFVPYEEVDWEHFDPEWKKGKMDDPGRDKWRKTALESEEGRRNLGPVLENGYMNLNGQNCFYIDDEFVFYNQGFCLRQLPANAILMQTIDMVYQDSEVWKHALITKEELMDRYCLTEYEWLWHSFIGHFFGELHHDKLLLEYNQQHRRDWKIVNENRYRMNYSENEYERVFQDIFRGTQGRKLYLFGSGIFASKFLEQFGSDYQVTGILDNHSDKWGMELAGIPILSPECLQSMAEDSYKVIICIKNCVPIIEQMKKLGVKNYSVYDIYREYPRKLPETAVSVKDKKQEPKKYHIGYVAGVFDLFHIGHLNMFKRAKEQCDYLIVGVVTDESVMNNKKTMPYMSFEERIELVRGCRYVDEAVELPTYNGDTDEAYRRYHFDVQFSGSDYADDPVWLAKKAYLEKRGAEMVFFPYTQTTSSSKLKELIKKGLL